MHHRDVGHFMVHFGRGGLMHPTKRMGLYAKYIFAPLMEWSLARRDIERCASGSFRRPPAMCWKSALGRA